MASGCRYRLLMEPSRNRQGLTAGQVARLNRTYFKSCPADYFDSRLWALLRLADVSQDEVLKISADSSSLSARFMSMFPDWQWVEDDDPPTRERAAILEAQALRHHVAETVVRVFKALVTSSPGDSVWFSLAADFQMGDLRTWVTSQLESDHIPSTIRDNLRAHAFPDYDALVTMVGDDDAQARLDVTAEWLTYFHWLLDSDGRDIAPAANQIKHGLGILVRDDIKMTFVKDLADPENPTAEELNAGFDIINATSIAYLRRHRVSKNHTWGWDNVLENADAASTLAQVHWGTHLLRLMWGTARVRFAPDLHSVDPQPIAIWSGPTPREVLARTSVIDGGLAEHLIPSKPKQPAANDND